MGTQVVVATATPVFRDYTVQQVMTKFRGGYVDITFPNGTAARFVDTTQLEMSVWIRDVHASSQPMTVVMTANGSTTIWTATTREDVIGFTVPKRLFDLGGVTHLSFVRIFVQWNVHNNHEFFLWTHSPVVKAVVYS